jgi:hypothetical protein
MASSKLTWSLLVFTFIAAIALRISATSAKGTFAEDEGFSLMYATGHASEYYETLDGKYPFGVWVKAAEWKKYTQPEQLFCFRKITRDMASFDIHPPLYFWILHVWTFIAGANLWTGPTLNMMISLFSILGLFGLARYVLCDSVEAALVACFWALSPSVFQMSVESKQYELLALIAILFVWQILRYTDSKRSPGLFDFCLLALLTFAGTLTHFHFNILVGGCGIYAIATLWGKQKNRLMTGVGAVLVGYLVFLWITPNFFQSFRNAQETLSPFSYEALRLRINNAINTCRQFFFNPIPFVPVRYLTLIALTVGGVMAYRQRVSGFITQWRTIRSTGLKILFFPLWTAGVQLALYFAFLTPLQSLLPKHLAMAWPFFAFLPAFIIRFFPRHKNYLAVIFCSLALLSGITGLRAYNKFLAEKPNPSTILSQTNAVVIDNVSIGYVPHILWKLADDTPVFIANRAYLLEHPHLWLSRLDSGAVYISVRSAEHFLGNPKEGREALYALIDQQSPNECIKDGMWGFGDIVKIQKKL